MRQTMEARAVADSMLLMDKFHKEQLLEKIKKRTSDLKAAWGQAPPDAAAMGKVCVCVRERERYQATQHSTRGIGSRRAVCGGLRRVSRAALRQLVAPHGWGNPAGRVGTRPPALYSPCRKPGVRLREQGKLVVWVVTCRRDEKPSAVEKPNT